MRKTALSLLLILPFSALFSQKLTDVSARWSDSFAEWVLFSTADSSASDNEPKPEEIGRLKLRWPDRDLWTEWDIECEDWRGTIRQKWDNEPDNWELRANGKIITMQTRWTGDFSEWKITSDRQQLILKSRYASPEEWLVKSGDSGRFYMYTLYRGDARDWAVEDDLGPEIGREMRMALVFTVLYNSTPNK